MQVSILGRLYDLLESSPAEDPNLKTMDGYCDVSVGRCVIERMTDDEPEQKQDIASYKRQVIRHELIHAFLAESGLQNECEWACEEMVDWLACQFPKIVKAFESVDVLI